VSPSIPGLKPVPARGSGPGGRVEISDIRQKLEEIRGDIDETTEKAKPIATYAAVAGVIVAVGVAFWLGRRRGRRKSTWVEIRRL
jgi:hypothetical protein